jgi:hypothetical protein
MIGKLKTLVQDKVKRPNRRRENGKRRLMLSLGMVR